MSVPGIRFWGLGAGGEATKRLRILPSAYRLLPTVLLNRYVPPKSRTVRRAHINAFRPTSDVVILFEPPINLRRSTWRRHEHLTPWAIGVGKGIMRRTIRPSPVRNNRDVIGGGQGPDVP